MLRKCNADVVFLHGEEPWLTRWFGLGAGLGDSAFCPAVYVKRETDLPSWNLETGHAQARWEKPNVTEQAIVATRQRWVAELGLQ